MINLYLGITIAVVVAIMLVFLFIWLIYERIRLKKELQALSEIVGSHKQDVAGLCAAALSVDERLRGHAEILTGMQEKLVDYKQAEIDQAVVIDSKPDEGASQSYSQAIQKVRSGASAAELIQAFGLSSGEAALLIRLHGSGADSKTDSVYASNPSVDDRLHEYAEPVRGGQINMTDNLKASEAGSQPYGNVIQKVRAGADVAELTKQFGLSVSEAALLIRLHGQNADKH